MLDTQTVAGAVDELAESVEEFWPVLEDDKTLEADDRAEITQLMEGAEDNLKAIKKLLHDISERE